MDWLGYLLYRLAGALAGILPLPALCRLGMAGGWCAYHLLPGYRRLALRNLEIAFGRELPPAERRTLARRHFVTLGGNLLGSLGVAQLTPEGVRAVTEAVGEEHIAAARAAGRGIVFSIGHLGNWELLSQYTPLVMERTGSIYQRLGNPLIDAHVRASRARLGLQLFERKEGFQGALRLLRACGGVGVLADQHAGDGGVWCPFFDRLASTSSLAATLALRSGARLHPITVYTLRPGRWQLVIGAPIPTEVREAAAVTVSINRDLEARIRHAPEDWFWVHNRWKTPNPKFLLGSYKRGLALLAPGETSARPLQPFRMLIRSSNWLGDAIMSVPAVRAIKAGRPDAHVTILTPAKLAAVWRSVPEVDEVLTIDSGGSVWAVAAQLREQKFDAAVLFPNSLRAALEVWLGHVPRRVGFPGHHRRWLLNQTFREKKKKEFGPPRHQVHQYLRLAEFLGAELDPNAARPVLPHPGEREARDDKRPARIAVCPGAEYGPAKRWPPERFAEAMRLVAERHSCQWTLVGVARDAPLAEEIVRSCGGVVVRNIVGETTLDELMAELRASDLLLTNDTGTMHLAAFLGVPVVAIFGSTEPALTGPLGRHHEILRQHVECSPCFLRVCPLVFRCMQAVSATQASEAIERLLSGNALASAASVTTLHKAALSD